MAGKFYPLSQYTNDLAGTLNGLTHIYPSKFVTCWFANADTIEADATYISEEMDTIRKTTTTSKGVPYADLRQFAFGSIYKLLKTTQTNDMDAPMIGDINFLSNEVVGGLMYSDIYVNISPQQGSKTIPMQEQAGDNPRKTAFAVDPTTGSILVNDSIRKIMTFNGIILYYNLYQIDPSSQSASTQRVCVDMPLGIYIPESPVTIEIEAEELFGQGTSWSTRICSRLASSASLASNSNPSRSSEYATLTKVLSEFGNISSVMDEILHNNHNTDSIGLAPQDIKAYLEEFRQENKVNVPYIKDNHWFVNGRDLGLAVSSGGAPVEAEKIKPDGEDLTSFERLDTTYFKFADKTYNADEFSGKGRIYLRKNIQDEKNLLIQSMLSTPNTIYIVQYDYDLNGESINVPENSVFLFQGGSFNNGELILNETSVFGVLNETDMGDAKFNGTYKTGQIFSSDESVRLKGTPYFKESTKNGITYYEPNYAKEGSYVTRNLALHMSKDDRINLLDSVDYQELTNFIEQFVDKHDAEMDAHYAYFNPRLTNMQNGLNALRETIITQGQAITTLQGQIEDLQKQIDELKTSTQRISSFIPEPVEGTTEGHLVIEQV